MADIDLSNANLEELHQIQNEVLRNIAFKVALRGDLAAGHDSHGSSHSKNSVYDFGGQIRERGGVGPVEG